MADTNEAKGLTVLIFLVQQIVLLLVTSGILAQIRYGTIGFEFRVQDGKVSHSKPSLELDIKAEATKT
jgi:hypothetical protein